MRFLPLVWAGMWRKRGRTILIFLQVAVAFALFGILQGMKTGMDQAIARLRADLLFVTSSAQGGIPLPIAYRERLQSIPGVKAVTFEDGLLGTYQRPTQTVFVLAIEPTDLWLTLMPELISISPKSLEALRDNRTGALISADIGRKYGWHIGDKIPLTTGTLHSDGSGTWLFDIVGTFVGHQPGAGSAIVVNYEYLDQGRVADKGTVRNFDVIASDPRAAEALRETIDRTFANSASGTRSFTLREGAQQSMQALGDLNFVIRSIVSAVLLALMFSTATMMMQTVRERTPELAVLKTLGFGDGMVFALVAAEFSLVCVVAALAGLALACLAFPLAAKFIPGLSMPLVVVELGLVGSVCVALISISVPGWRAARLKIVDALAGR